MRTLPFIATLGLALVLGSCASAPRPAPRPPSPVVIRPAPIPTPAPLASDWRDWPMTPGDWVYRQDGRGSIALFGASGADALLTLRCDRDTNMVYLSRAGLATGTVPLTVRTSTLLRTLGATPTGGSPAYLAVALTPRDNLLEAMGFSRGRFVVQQAGAATLVVPAWAEILRVTEDCRR